ncbi:Pre-mRNA-processing factor [Arachis hypogaea]|nr:Pre-mRNA-processing factor [Arachis hypogaea]
MAKASKACAFLRRCPSLTLGSMLEEIAAILPGHEFASVSDIQFCCQNMAYADDDESLVEAENVPKIHFFNARFKEQIGDVLAARAAYIQQTGKESDSDFVQNVISRANMEKRLGNMESACGIYKEAIEMVVAEENLQHALPNLYVHFSHLKYMVEKNSKNPILLSGCKVADGSDVLLSFAMLMASGSDDALKSVGLVLAGLTN